MRIKFTINTELHTDNARARQSPLPCFCVPGIKRTSYLSANLAEPIILTGHLVLNLSIVVLYFVGRFHYRRLVPGEEPTSIAQPLTDLALKLELPETTRHTGGAEKIPRVPKNIRLLLSDREYLFLFGTLDRKNFREIADELSIAESTVKTYMRRITKKWG